MPDVFGFCDMTHKDYFCSVLVDDEELEEDEVLLVPFTLANTSAASG